MQLDPQCFSEGRAMISSLTVNSLADSVIALALLHSLYPVEEVNGNNDCNEEFLNVDNKAIVYTHLIRKSPMCG